MYGIFNSYSPVVILDKKRAAEATLLVLIQYQPLR